MIKFIKENILSVSLFVLFSILGFNTILIDTIPCLKHCTKNFKYLIQKNDDISHLKIDLYCNYSSDNFFENIHLNGHLFLSEVNDPGKVRFNSLQAKNSIFFSTEEDFYIKNRAKEIFGTRDLVANRVFLGIVSDSTDVKIKKDNNDVRTESRIKILSENRYYSELSKFSLGLSSIITIFLIFVFTINNRQDEFKTDTPRKPIIIMNA